ncbi:glutathione S-transferase N-terminal domain-containing protein [Hyphomonas sp.]|uniref:glutathione S-transferase N-terminal domain-containing protein n=1 Tax=Hyphomonas sp. TaxID=87 RepID=UPI0025BDF636|nr:glutathione S-transferase N-terminal domain-containing protein [Hyphomonas sp.]
MKLHYSATSPYARKVRVLIIEQGLQAAVELVRADPMAENAASKIGNPLSKVPSLELEDGTHLFDSPVICEYLDHMAGGDPLLPVEGARRWAVLKAQALGDGILDAALSLVMESRRPDAQQSKFWQARWISAIHRGVDDIANDVRADDAVFDLGRISYACALGYLDFRLPDLDWRAPHPGLADWFSDMSGRESFALTAPPE